MDLLKIDLLEPDKGQLDVEWEQQPKLYHELADILNDSRKILKLTEIELQVLEAEIELSTRRSQPKEFGLEKFTEGSIHAILVSHPDWQALKRKIVDLEEDVEAAQIDVRTAEHRKSALENLVRLMERDYFADPRVGGESGRRLEEQSDHNTFRKTSKPITHHKGA